MRTGKQLRSVFLVLGFMVLLLAAACTPQTPAEPTDPEVTPEVTTEDGSQSPAATVASEEPQEQEQGGGTILIGKPQEATGTDPHLFGNAAEWQIFALVYEQLIGMDENLQPIPMLAESWSTEDGITYQFKIREGVLFHNGREMTADDVAWSIQRLIDPETGSYLTVALGPVEEIRATGPYEVEITMSEKSAGLIPGLAGAWASILPAQEIQAGEMDPATDLLGTGPFKVVRHLQDQEWVFESHDEYWGGEPSADGVVMKIIKDDSARIAALRTGEIHLSVFESPGVTQLLEGIPNVQTEVQTTTDHYLLFLNSAHEPLDDVNVRRAISSAIDRQELQEVALYGTGQLTGPVPSPMEDLATPVDELPFYTFDPALAEQLLEEADLSSPVELTLYTSSSHPTFIDIALVLQEQLSEVGIEVEIVDRELGAFVQDYWVNGLHDMALTWFGGYGDPVPVLSWMPSAAAAATGKEDPQLGELLNIAAAADSAERPERYAEVEEYMAEEATVIYLNTLAVTIGYRSDLLEGVDLYPVEGYGNPFRTLEQTYVVNP